MSDKKLRLGEMLVQAGLVTTQQIDSAIALQATTGRRLGETLIEMEVVSETQVAQTLSSQLAVPWVNLQHVEFSRELLLQISQDTARKYAAVPVYIRKLKAGRTLFVATDDPTNEIALQTIAAEAGMPVRAMVASTSEVRGAIRAYYGGEPLQEVPTAVGKRVPKGSPAAVISHPPEARPSEAPPTTPEATESESKPPKGFMTLTLLDGTTVRLPTKSAQTPESGGHGLTTRDLIAALTAKAQGKDVGSVLPTEKLELVLAALLQVLLRKGLVTDWEFVEELGKRLPQPKP